MSRFAAAALVRAIAMRLTLLIVMIVVVVIAMVVLVIVLMVGPVVVPVVVVVIVIPVPVIPALGINRATPVSAAITRAAWHFHTRHQSKSQRGETQEAKTDHFHGGITTGWGIGIKQYRVA
jgi:hypothetical protein